MSYTLDVDNSQLNLTFNLPVFGGSAVNPAAIVIQSSENGRTHYSRLSACSRYAHRLVWKFVCM